MRKLSHAGQDLLGFAMGFFSLVSRLKPSRWVEENMYLPTGGSETKPGKVSFDKAPFWREPLDDLVDPAVRDVIVIAPTRMGKTFLLRMVFAYVVAILRVPLLWYDSTMSKASSVSKKELQPLVERNKVLRDRKPVNPDHFTNTMMLFPAAHFEMFGANSDAQSSGETAAVVLGNELGKWRDSTETEASILEQTRHRTESYDGIRKHFYVTTPTVESAVEWLEFLDGDQRKIHVPCPHCGTMQQMEWGEHNSHHGLKWSKDAQKPDGSWDFERVAGTVGYRCKNTECTGELWTQAQVWTAIREHYQWIPTAEPKVPWKRTYQLNGFAGHLESNTMASLAQAFLASRKTSFIADRRDFWNASMGMPWVNDIRTITAKSFSELERNYMRGEMPAGFRADFYIAGVDVQSWGLPWVWLACSYAGDAYVVDWGVAASWSDLDQIQSDYAGSANSWLIIDIRYAARRPETLQAIYERRHRHWCAFQGEDVTQDLVKAETANPFAGGKLEKNNAKVLKLVVSTYNFKIELENRYSGEIKKTFFPQLPIAADANEIEEQTKFYKQLKDERRVPRKNKRKGLPPDEFRARTGNNHWGDCMVMGHSLLFWLQHRRTKKARKGRREVKVES